MSDLLKTFDSWGDILEKARKPKGLGNWKKLSHVAERLADKQAAHITFTCAHPSHEGAPMKHTLGSTVGNAHFLLGYGNPAFYLADYHWQVIDPYLSPEEIKDRQHPSDPELWTKMDLDVDVEGDVSEGDPHPAYKNKIEGAAEAKKLDAERITVKEGYSVYDCYPSQGMVYNTTNGHVYDWSLVKNSFFSAMNPEVAEKMNEFDVEAELMEMEEPEAVEKGIPSRIHTLLTPAEFSPYVYSVIQKSFPQPGSAVPLTAQGDETIYGVITPVSIDFYDKTGNPLGVPVYDRVYKSFDLTQDGDIHPTILMNFATKYMGVDKSLLEEFVSKEAHVSSEHLVKSTPTPGFEDVSDDYASVEPRKVIVVGNTYRVVPE